MKQKTTVNLAIETTTWAVVTGAGLVILAAGVLSFSALKDLFGMMGLFPDWLAWLFPLLFDLTEVSFALAVWNSYLQGREDKWAWKMVVIFTLVGVIANVTHAVAAYGFGNISRQQAALAVFLTSLFPVSVALATHLLKQTITLAVERSGRPNHKEVDLLSELQKDLDKLRQQVQTLPASVSARTGRKEARKQRLLAWLDENPAATKNAAYEHLGVAKSTGQTYFEELEADGLLVKNGKGWEVAG